jgi:pSer/pThr/pTyr-binding forkhead associated (FHA) protein
MTPASSKASLQVVHATNDETPGRAIPLDAESFSMGRGEDNALVINSDQASRHHARIQATPAGHVLVDLGSTNGTFVNSKPVKEQRLVHGDVVRIASTVLKYVVE